MGDNSLTVNVRERVKSVDPKTYFIYHGRWQVSAMVMAVPMAIVSNYTSATAALFIVQFIGAIIFFPIDKLILND